MINAFVALCPELSQFNTELSQEVIVFQRQKNMYKGLERLMEHSMFKDWQITQ